MLKYEDNVKIFKGNIKYFVCIVNNSVTYTIFPIVKYSLNDRCMIVLWSNLKLIIIAKKVRIQAVFPSYYHAPPSSPLN